MARRQAGDVENVFRVTFPVFINHMQQVCIYTIYFVKPAAMMIFLRSTCYSAVRAGRAVVIILDPDFVRA